MTTAPTTAEPLFHLRAYGDVTEAELTKYATPAEIAQPATPEPPQASAPSVQVVEPRLWFLTDADDIDGDDPRSDVALQSWQAAHDAFNSIGTRGFSEWCERVRLAVAELLKSPLAQASALQAAIPAQQPADELFVLQCRPTWTECPRCLNDMTKCPLYASPTAQPATPQPAPWPKALDKVQVFLPNSKTQAMCQPVFPCFDAMAMQEMEDRLLAQPATSQQTGASHE